MAMTVENAKKELERINKELTGYSKLLERRNLLQQFLALADQLSAHTNTTPRIRSVPAISNGHKRTTPEAARAVLQNGGPLHLKEIIKRMRESGWTGSDKPGNAEKAVYVCMLRNPKWFIKVGSNVWTLKKEEHEKAAS